MLTFRTGRLAALPTLLLAVLSTVTVVGFRRVFDGWNFLPFLIALSLTVHAVAAASRVFRLHILIATPLALIASMSVIAVRMFPASVRFGFLPTGDTFRLASTELVASWQEFSSSVAPVPARGGYLLVAALAVAVMAFTSDTFAMRAFGRVEAVIPAAVVFVFVSVLGETGQRPGRLWITAVWLFVACISVALLRDDHGEMTSTRLGSGHVVRALRVGLAAALLSVSAVGVASLVAPHLPGATSVGIIHPQDSSENDAVAAVSPMVDIRGRLTGNNNRIMFRVKANRPYYWHLTSLPDFDGKVWQSNESFVSTNGKLRTKPRGQTLKQTVTIVQMGEGWVPAAFEAVAISGKESFVYNPETATVRLAGDTNLVAGLTYTVSSVTGSYTAKQLGSASARRPPDERYVSLPDSFPEDLRATAESVVEGTNSPYARVRALQDWFRDNFVYDLDVRYSGGTKGMKEFITARRGFCEQFASTFAAFARSLGIPARVAVGFTPGVIENGEYVVRARNAHAWPEVWFDRIGWVSFEPTPGRGAPGNDAYTGVPPAQDETVEPETSDSAPSSASTPTTAAPSSGSDPSTTEPVGGATGPDGESGPQTADTSVTDTTPSSGESGTGSALRWLVLLAVLLALGGAGYLWVRVLPNLLRDRRRRLTGSAPADRVLHAWQDVTVLMGLLGVARRADETPLEHVVRTRTSVTTFGVDHVDLELLATAATRALYARETIDAVIVSECIAVAQRTGLAVLATSPRSVRWRLRLDPRLASRLAQSDQSSD